MSQQNNEYTGYFMIAALFGAGFLLFGAVIFACLSFLAFVMTLIALCAWFKPVTLGSVVFLPREARAFVYRGLIGMALLPFFAAFCAFLFGLQVAPELWFYLLVGGYSLGSAGIALLESGGDDQAAAQAQLSLDRQLQIGQDRPAVRQADRTPVQPAEEVEPFRFASWDDEEELNR